MIFITLVSELMIVLLSSTQTSSVPSHKIITQVFIRNRLNVVIDSIQVYHVIDSDTESNVGDSHLNESV